MAKQIITLYHAGQKTITKDQQPLEQQTKYIEVGLLPPAYRFDDREELKAQINKCYKEQYDVIKKGNATKAYSEWEWFGCKKNGCKNG